MPGDQIPGEQELCELYWVSRTVVRQALRELELDGMITRRKGKGTFISPPKISEGLVQKLTGFYQDMVERGLRPSTKVLHQNVVPATEKVARFLTIAAGRKGHRPAAPALHQRRADPAGDQLHPLLASARRWRRWI